MDTPLLLKRRKIPIGAEIDKQIDNIIGNSNNKVKRTKVNRKQKRTYLSLLPVELLTEVFSYSDFNDLLQISKMDRRFYQIITEHIIPKKILDFKQIHKHLVKDVFRMFGRFATHIKVDESDIPYEQAELSRIEEILCLLKDYCSSDQLRTISLSFNEREPEFLHGAEPIFRNIETLSISGSFRENNRWLAQELFLKKIISASVNLRSLKLSFIKTRIGWLLLPDLQKLQSLSFEHCRLNSYENWHNFLQSPKKPQLKTFRFKGKILYTQIEPICDEITSNFPNLTELSVVMDDQINYLPVVQLKNLKVLEISAKSIEIFPMLHLLAKNNTVERLIVNLNKFGTFSESFDRGNFQCFSSLRCVEIVNPKIVSMAFLSPFLCGLPNLTKCCLKKHRIIRQDIISNIVKLLKKLKTLRVEAPAVFSEKFLNVLAIERKESVPSGMQPLRVYIKPAIMTMVASKGEDYLRRSKEFITLWPLQSE